MSKKTSQYRGVTKSSRLNTNPWLAQVVAAGVNHYLGNYPTEGEAAQAYDNAAYWLNLEGFRTGGLNFPDDYAKPEYTPSPTVATRKALAKYRMRLAARPTPPGDTRHPDAIAIDEAIKSLKQIRNRIQLAHERTTQTASSNLAPVTSETTTGNTQP